VTDTDDIAELQRQVRRQGELIDALYRQVGIGQLDENGIPTGGAFPDVIDAIRDGSMIGAIKLYREHTGATLVEAKAAVEALQRTL
jgi:ribosomal protein L7/L12